MTKERDMETEMKSIVIFFSETEVSDNAANRQRL